ncbi:MAG TPA: PQQ-binding-like beta-propeller repeat protein, partial [Balneolales bacterium]|nr:PQQ-binding-like beta-propeller repeat protein [Balneolales bacterium]
FDRKNNKTVKCINLNTGKINWASDNYKWNLKQYNQAGNLAVRKAFKAGLGAGIGADVAEVTALQTRMIQNMIREIPGKHAFLFKTVHKLYYIDSKSGKIKWSSTKLNSSGISLVKYLPKTNRLLIIGNMSTLKDLIKSTVVKGGMKQVMLVNADDGSVIWGNKYHGNGDHVHAEIRKNLLILHLTNGSAESYQMNNGKRMFGTRDNMQLGPAKLVSKSHTGNFFTTSATADPLLDGQSVYAINPEGEKAAGIPNKILFKFNYQTGKTIWDNKTLKSATDVRDMILHGDKIIVRVSSTAPDSSYGTDANVINHTLDLGFYAFSKKEGKMAWKLTEPFQKVITNVVYGKDAGWAAGKHSICKFSLDTGKILAQISLDSVDVKKPDYIHSVSGNKLVIVAQTGIAVVKKSDCSIVYSNTPKGNVVNYYIGNDRMVASFEPLLSKKETVYIYNMNHPGILSSYSLERPDNPLKGNLFNAGFYVTKDMKQIIRLTKLGMDSEVL